MMTRATLARLIVLMLVLTAVISVGMLQINWDGVAASKEADDVDTLLDVMIVLSSFVYSIVLVMLGYSLWRYRAKPGDESDGEPIHGNTKIEIAWTVIPTIIVLFGAAYSWVILDKIEAKEPDRLHVKVTAQQFAWKFEYPKQGVTSTDLHVPVDRQVEFDMTAEDVIHSFWVPEWRVKKDLVPGMTTHVSATPDLEGHYTLVCTELCGIGHSTMRAPVDVESQAAFDKWIKKQGGKPETGAASAAAANKTEAAAAGSSAAAEGEGIFTGDAGCGGCHTLKAAGATGTIGPNLDQVLPKLTTAEIRQSIEDPGAKITPGFSDGIMPTDFAKTLGKGQIDALVAFLSQSAKGGK